MDLTRAEQEHGNGPVFRSTAGFGLIPELESVKDERDFAIIHVWKQIGETLG